jgi:hypothetical protein
MKCLKCGKEMEEGWLVNPYTIRWSSSMEKPSWAVRKHYDITETEELITPSDKFWRIQGVAIRAYRCPDCKIVVFSYGESEKRGE